MEPKRTIDHSPGRLLRTIAERVASRATCERVLFPLLADLQFEHAGAPSTWARGFVRARGALAFWRAFAITSMVDSGRHLWANAWGSSDQERQAIQRLLVRMAMGATVVTAPLLAYEYPRLRSLHLGSACFLLIPSIIPVALPIATLFAFALDAKARDAKPRRAAVGVVLVAGLATFTTAAWLNPVANQNLRERLVRAVAPEFVGPLAKGDRELTFGQLAAFSLELQSTGRGKEAARFDVEWHKKLALGASCLALALAGAAIASGLRKRAWRFVAAFAVFNGAYVLLRVGEQAADLGRLSPALAMWGPFLLIAAASVAGLAVARRRDAVPAAS
jgi:Lipopolysaccharide export system permease LptF/LptG